MKFHLNRIVPAQSALHGLHGYNEVVETLQWGLNELGHETTSGVNEFASGRINIVFGFQILEQAELDRFPLDTIVYNLEQLAGRTADRLTRFRAVARRLRIWEYSAHNLPAWQQLHPSRELVHVPVGWAPLLARIPRAVPQDIDVLFYGLPGDARLAAFKELGGTGASCVFACGLYGAARDGLIARARIVLNLSNTPQFEIFEIVRVSYLLANAKAVVAGRREDTFVEPDLRDAVDLVPADCVVTACLSLLENEPARLQLEERGEQIMRKRDIRTILSQALAASGLAAA